MNRCVRECTGVVGSALSLVHLNLTDFGTATEDTDSAAAGAGLDRQSPSSLLERLKPTVDRIEFRNYFVGSVTIKQLQWSPAGATAGDDGQPQQQESKTWQTILQSYKLMRSCHCESSATLRHSIPTSLFSPSHYIRDSDAPIRIYLEQPSPTWKTYCLREISVIGSCKQGKHR